MFWEHREQPEHGNSCSIKVNNPKQGKVYCPCLCCCEDAAGTHHGVPDAPCPAIDRPGPSASWEGCGSCSPELCGGTQPGARGAEQPRAGSVQGCSCGKVWG